MNTCLVCQKEIIYSLSLKSLWIGRYQENVLCSTCLKQEDILDTCHHHFFERRNYQYYLAFSMCYAPILKKYKQYTIITHPPIRQNNIFSIDYTYKIVQNIIPTCLSIMQCKENLSLNNQPILCVDYNGICQENWEKMPKECKIERLTLWRREYGDFKM
ncbi:MULTISPECIES: hypothetical protein [unclassified Granulicatella]|uniref:hypothetical protein n=1 Tax=unclassified Granulicatella TaxID=2630493 RepID=UPI001074531E|nr:MULTISPECIES: hypothetical protein [unclassified Granulicatella]MBF0779995.1 hypothetical protein [Granulicatella sp. 19428wC4_WM01]TFU95922.1 hypothetical protein E4T68_02690 [Granulicatella sp. WM01]